MRWGVSKKEFCLCTLEERDRTVRQGSAQPCPFDQAQLEQDRTQSDQGLLGELDVSELLAGSHHVLVLDSHDSTAPLSGEVGVVIELRLEGRGELLEVDEVFSADVGEGDAGSGLKVDELAEVGLSADEAEGDTLLSAESGEVHHDLDGVDVVGDDNKLGLVLLDESGHVVETKLEVHGLLGLVGGVLVLSTGLGLSLESEGLLLVGLGHVLGEQFKKLGGCNCNNKLGTETKKGRAISLTLVLLEGLSELVDGGGHLESLHQNSLLTLDSDVARPPHKASEVALGLNISSKTEVASVLLEERSGPSASSASSCTRLNDLLSLSFLHLNGTTKTESDHELWAGTTCKRGQGLMATLPALPLTIMIDIFYLINNNTMEASLLFISSSSQLLTLQMSVPYSLSRGFGVLGFWGQIFYLDCFSGA